MLDVNLIRENPAKVKEGILKKGGDVKLVDKFLNLDEKWRKKVASLDNLKAEQNVLNKKIGQEKNAYDLARAQVLKKSILDLEKEVEEIFKKRQQILFKIPNLPFDDVPVGKDENDNKVIKEVGKKPVFDFNFLDYLTLADKLDLIDIERAAKVSGSRFGYIKNELVLLEFAIIQFVFEKLLKHNFIPLLPPVLIKKEMMQAMGYLDRKDDLAEVYYFPKDDLFLVGTSEQSIGPMHKDEVFKEEDLPKRYLGFSTCFRREAGSYGKDTKGILRVHQFDKLEMFVFCLPQDASKEHLFLLDLVEEMMQALKLPYRVVEICTADLGNTAARKYDIETWLPSFNAYRETHSISNVTDYQARRLNIKYHDKKLQKNQYVFTLNGTAFALGRILIAIIENYQTKDGKIKVPEVLKKYLNFEIIG